MSSASLKLCPYCAEEVKLAAIVCKHCGRDIPAVSVSPTPGLSEASSDSEVTPVSMTARCWSCGANDQKTSGWCTWCGVDLAKQATLDEEVGNNDATKPVNLNDSVRKNWVWIAAIAALVVLIFVVANLAQAGKNKVASGDYPVASTVREAVAYSVSHYCSQAPSAIGDPSNWMSMGGNSAFINTTGGRITLQASLPGADGTPGEVSAADSLSQSAMDAWNCKTPMLVSAPGD
jgi:Double zinc ribbon